MYRKDGPEHLRSVGEIEYANGVAAMAASGQFGEARIAAAIVGGADLRLGRHTRETLEHQLAAAPARFRGVRAQGTGFDPALPALSRAIGSAPKAFEDPAFLEGLGHLRDLGLSADIFLFESQLPELAELLVRCSDVPMILNHVGMPTPLRDYAKEHEERFRVWSGNIGRLSRFPNLVVKLGGLGNAMCGFPLLGTPEEVTSDQLVPVWRPYIETCIQAFGVERCMFESNFPVDRTTATYPVVWNSFKKITLGMSATEKEALYSGTASRIYRINL
jgi:predicted TIM-barrel fold metal-dependent hydrolase